MAIGRSSDISSAFRAISVTASDSTELPTFRALYVGTTGNITVRMAQDNALIQFTNVPVGILPVQGDQVRSTGTTASGIVALY